MQIEPTRVLTNEPAQKQARDEQQYRMLLFGCKLALTELRAGGIITEDPNVLKTRIDRAMSVLQRTLDFVEPQDTECASAEASG